MSPNKWIVGKDAKGKPIEVTFPDGFDPMQELTDTLLGADSPKQPRQISLDSSTKEYNLKLILNFLKEGNNINEETGIDRDKIIEEFKQLNKYTIIDYLTTLKGKKQIDFKRTGTKGSIYWITKLGQAFLDKTKS